MKLIQPLSICSDQVFMLTQLKKGKHTLVKAVNLRIASVFSRAQQQELLAFVDLHYIVQLLTAFETGMRAKADGYQALMQEENSDANKLKYKEITIIMCHIGTPAHSLFASCLEAMDKVFCAIHTLKVHHASKHRIKAGALVKTLFDECVRWVFKLIYLPSHETISIENFLALSEEEQKSFLAKNYISSDQLKEAIVGNSILLPDEIVTTIQTNMHF